MYDDYDKNSRAYEEPENWKNKRNQKKPSAGSRFGDSEGIMVSALPKGWFRRLIDKLNNYIHGGCIVLMLTAFLSCINGMTVGTPQFTFLTSMSLLIPLIVSDLAADRVRSFVLFLPICLASLVPVYFIAPSVYYKVIFLVLGIIIIIIRTVSRLKNQLDFLSTPHYAFIFFLIGFYIAIKYTGAAYGQTCIYYMAFIYIINLFVYTNLNSLDGYLISNVNVHDVPVRAIRRMNNGGLLLFLVLLLGVMFVFPISGFDRIIGMIGSLLLTIIRAFFSLFHFKSDEYEELPQDKVEPNMDFSGIGEEIPATWLTTLWEILQYIVTVAMILGAIALLIYGIYRLVRAFYRPIKENEDVTEFIMPFKEESTSLFGEREGGFFRNLFARTPSEAVRKTYVKTIRKQKKKVDSDSYTPSEIERYVELEQNESSSILHKTYEKARYSEHGVNAEEAAAVKR